MLIIKKKLIVAITLSSLISAPLLTYAEPVTLDSSYASEHNVGSNNMLGSDPATWSPEPLNQSVTLSNELPFYSDDEYGVKIYDIDGDVLLNKGKFIYSLNKTFKLILQDDGNLVEYNDKTGKALWASNTLGKDANDLVLQADGNVVLYNNANKAIFATDTLGKGRYIAITNNGNISIYDKNYEEVWNNGVYSFYGVDKSTIGGYKITNSTDDDLSAEIAISNKDFTKELFSKGDGADRFILQGDGNAVAYRKDSSVAWASDTYGRGWGLIKALREKRAKRFSPVKFCIGNSGEITFLNSKDVPLWFIGRGGYYDLEQSIAGDNKYSADKADDRKCWDFNGQTLLTPGKKVESKNKLFYLELTENGKLNFKRSDVGINLDDYRDGLNVPQDYSVQLGTKSDDSVFLPFITPDMVTPSTKIQFQIVHHVANGKADGKGKLWFPSSPAEGTSDDCWTNLQNSMKPGDDINVDIKRGGGSSWYTLGIVTEYEITYSHGDNSCTYGMSLNPKNSLWDNAAFMISIGYIAPEIAGFAIGPVIGEVVGGGASLVGRGLKGAGRGISKGFKKVTGRGARNNQSILPEEVPHNMSKEWTYKIFAKPSDDDYFK